MIETTIENGVQQFVHIICAIIYSKTRFLEPEKRRKVFRLPPKWLMPELPTKDHSKVSFCSVDEKDMSLTVEKTLKASIDASNVNEVEKKCSFFTPFSPSQEESSNLNCDVLFKSEESR